MKLSVISPAYNEEEVIPFFFERVENVCSQLEEAGTIESYEILIIDDGSTDNTWNIIKKAHNSNRSIRGVRFSRNFGHHSTTIAGLDHARGDFMIFMDSDLQAQPEDIPKLLEEHLKGAEIVWGVARERNDTPFVTMGSKLFYWIFNKIAGVKILKENVMAGCSRKASREIIQMREIHQFAPALWNYVGFRNATIELEKKKRFRGTVKYNFRRRINLALVSIVGFSKFPLKISSVLGFIMSFAGIVLGAYIVIVKIFSGIPVPGYASILATVAFFLGIQFLILGIIGEYIGIILDEVKKRPLYIIGEDLDDTQ